MPLEQQRALAEKSIVERAAEIMRTFLHPENTKVEEAQWLNIFKKDAMIMLWECNHQKIAPPTDLVCLVGCLFGESHNWSYAKYATVNFLALNYAPFASVDDIPRGLKSKVHRVIASCGGSRKTAKFVKVDPRSDFRKNIESWLEDELFMQMWEYKHLYYQMHKPDEAALAAVKEGLLLAAE